MHDKTSGNVLALGILLFVAGAALLARSLPASGGNPENAAVSLQRQTLVYERCGHEVLRSLPAPDAWAGLPRAEIERAVAGEWRVTGFSGAAAELRRALPMFCPAHAVLALDADGNAGVYRNEFGEDMTLQTKVPLPAGLSEEERAKWARGIGFDTEDALWDYVSSAGASRTTIP